MKRLLISVSAIAAALSLVVGLGSAVASSTSATSAAKISVAKTGLGRILVDGRGHTLYLFAKDARGKSTCNGACAGFWPPLLASGKAIGGPGVNASLLGWTKRADGRRQVTYNHHPLYTFVKDTRKGQTNGQEIDAFGAEWYALSPAGTKVENKQAGSTSDDSSDPAAGGYGDGYAY